MEVIYSPGEHEDPRPGRGGLAPRAWVDRTDAKQLSLNGDWRFRLSPTAAVPGGDEFAKVDFDDAAKQWSDLPVPSHWVLHGHGSPAYVNIPYPFPVDPPFVPTENPTGDYRYAFDLPKDWNLANGKVGQRVLCQGLSLDCPSLRRCGFVVQSLGQRDVARHVERQPRPGRV